MKMLKEISDRFQSNQSSYDIPDLMPAQVILKGNSELKLDYKMVPVPSIGKDEALIAVKAAGLNFNTIWSVQGQPVSSFDFLKRMKLTANTEQNHNLDYHIPGSDASGFIVKLGTSDTRWNLGEEVVVNCNWHRNDDPKVFEDSLLSNEQKIWGYETNFGSFAAFSVVKIHQLMPKPRHLDWFESASYGLVLSTAYRMLISDHGAKIRLGDNVLIWGGAGGLGMAAIQLCKLAGANPIPVVSSDRKGELLASLGVTEYINRVTEKLDFWKSGEHNMLAWRKLRNILQKRFGGPADVVFEHPGRDTMAASIYALRKGGKVVTCAATTGYDISYDNRFLWMESKSIIGCHFANPSEAAEANKLMESGVVKPCVSSVHSFEDVNIALETFVSNAGFGKVVLGVLADPDSIQNKNETNT